MEKLATRQKKEYVTPKPRLIIKKRKPKFRLTLSRVASTLGTQVFRMFRIKTGLMGCSAFGIALATYTATKGPYLQDNYMRYALAGTMATVAVEFGIHGIDTLNMRSKAVEGNKHLLINVYKLEGFASLFRGVTAVVYGYAFSSIVYFYGYAYMRDIFYEKFRQRNQAKIEAQYKERSQ